MQIGDYEDCEQIGAGAFGVTYRARHQESGDVVALKKLEVRRLTEWKPFDRFEREVKVLRSLSHPGVVRFIDAFETGEGEDTAFYIVSQFIEGPTLGGLIEEGRRWEEDAARQLLEALLETLEYLHGLSPRVVHRDIKPGNIVLTDGERPVLIDFGSVTDLASRTEGGPTISGTAGYMAPEQAMGAVDPRSDLFGLGATMVHALTHMHPSSLPRDGLSFDLSEALGCSDHLERVLVRLLHPEPSQRFQSATEALAALRGEEEDAGDEKALAVPAASELIPAAPRPVTKALVGLTKSSRARGVLGSRLRVKTFAMMALWAIGSIALLPRLGLFTLPVEMLGIFGIFLGVRAWAREKALQRYEHGELVVGEVQEINARQAMYAVDYDYMVGGTRHRGQLATNDLVAMKELDRGDAVHVFYDPADPTQHFALLPREVERVTKG